MGRIMGVQLDGEFDLYASRRRLRAWPGGGGGWARSWTGNLLSTSLSADFGPGPVAAAEGPKSHGGGGGAAEGRAAASHCRLRA